MTPERLALLRDGHFPDAWTAGLFNELADALEAAWAERDTHSMAADYHQGMCAEIAEAHENAEALVVELRARADLAEAALARVRELCDVMRKNNGPYATLLELAIEGGAQ